MFCVRCVVHVYGTGCQHIYASVIVSDNLNGCSRLICLVLKTEALCDIFVRSAVYKYSYLLTTYFKLPSVGRGHVASVRCLVIYCF